uniref:PDZ domain-containing protein n=1 Tax=Ascaris lumbricoides TaxID=6252 RepID=A0A9J2PQS0_ASCLU
MVASIVIKANIDIGELPGIHYTNDLVVTFVQRSGAMDGKLKVGDKILTVNDQPVDDRCSFERIIRRHHIHRFTIVRDPARGEQIMHEQQVPADKNIARREGFIYLMLTIEQRKSANRLGLMVKNGEPGSVYVSRVSYGSLSAEKLQVGDRILELDGVVISDKEAAKKAFIKGLTSSAASVSVIVERPDSALARGMQATIRHQ